jgi:acetylornithine deacetylase/succinyl-diaminopimelate desuccinylase-like protein
MEGDTVRFLADLVRTQSFSSKEGAVIAVIKKEMKQIGFDEVRIDGLGNIIGRIGSGPRVIAFDGHVDTVYPGDLSQWTFDPFEPPSRTARSGAAAPSTRRAAWPR